MPSVSIVTHFICVLVLACFCIIMTMSNWASQFQLQSIRKSLLYVLYTIFFSVGVLSITYSTFMNNRSNEIVQRSKDQQTFLLSFGGMTLFFVGILIMDSLHLANLAYCMNSFVSMECDMFKVTGYLLYHCSKPTYLGAQLMFMIWVRYNRLNRGFALVSKAAHSINIAVNLALVIYCSSYESRGDQDGQVSISEGYDSDFFQCNRTNTSAATPFDIISPRNFSCMTGNTTLQEMNRSITPYIFPMQVQFASLAISVMIGQVALSGHQENFEEEEEQPVVFPSLHRLWNYFTARIPPFFRRTVEEERTPLLPNSNEPQPSAFTPLLIIGLFLCFSQLIAGVLSYRNLSSTVWFVIFINYGWYISLVACCICILKHMYANTRAVLYTPLPSSAIVILISSACAYNLNFYKLIANADIVARPLNESQKIMNQTHLAHIQLDWFNVSSAIGYTLLITRVVLQSLIIIRICRELSMTTYCLGLTGIVRTSLYYLLIANITNWLWNSAIGVKRRDPVKITYYTEDVWRSLVRAFMPGFMYFEFHSFTILAEYMIAQYRSNREDRPHAQMEEIPEDQGRIEGQGHDPIEDRDSDGDMMVD